VEKPEFKEIRDLLVANIPLRRVGEMNDMKAVAVFLASEASQYITGHVLVVDGGILAK